MGLVLLAWGLLISLSGGGVQAAGRDTGTLSSTPALGPAGAVITVSGAGWTQLTNGTAVTFGYSQQDCENGYTPASLTQPGTVQNGSFSGWLSIPTGSPIGVYAICAQPGGSGTVTQAGSYTLLSSAAAAIAVAPGTVKVGQTVTISGTNFLPGGTQVTLVLRPANGAVITLGTVTSNVLGAFSSPFTLPADLSGAVQVQASAGGGSPPVMSASFALLITTVAVPPKMVTATPDAIPHPDPGPTATARATPTHPPTSVQSSGNGASATATATIAPSTPQPGPSAPPAEPPLGQILPLAIATGIGGLLLFSLLGGLLHYRNRRHPPVRATLAAGAGSASAYETPVPAPGQEKPLVRVTGRPPEVEGLAPTSTAATSAQPAAHPAVRPPEETPEAPEPAAGSVTAAPAASADTDLESLIRQVQHGLSLLPGRSQRTGES